MYGVVHEALATFVPVILSVDKKDIVSYPASTYVYFKGKLAYPFVLKNGYYRGNRGINEHVAFTDFTYEEFATLKSAPGKNELIKRIIDKNALVEIVYCGPQRNYTNEVAELNQLIEEGLIGIKVVKFPELQVDL